MLFLLQFDCQDVMVPWHLQPKYTGNGKATAADTKAVKGVKTQVKGRRGKGRGKGRGARQGLMEGDTVYSTRMEDTDMDNTTAAQTPTPEGGVKSEGGQEGGVKSEGQKAGVTELGYTTYQRYYHVFRQGELVDLVHRTPGLSVEQDFYDHENWCVLAVKNNV